MIIGYFKQPKFEFLDKNKSHNNMMRYYGFIWGIYTLIKSRECKK